MLSLFFKFFILSPRFTIDSVSGNTLSFSGEVRFDHFGEIYEGVDMRAEVGLITRKVVIRGEVSFSL